MCVFVCVCVCVCVQLPSPCVFCRLMCPNYVIRRVSMLSCDDRRMSEAVCIRSLQGCAAEWLPHSICNDYNWSDFSAEDGRHHLLSRLVFLHSFLAQEDQKKLAEKQAAEKALREK